MTRRDWLIKVFGATVAATLAPLVDLTDETPAFWNQAPIKKLMPWCVTFQDGTTCTFEAKVIREELFDDGHFRFEVQPTGPMRIEQGTSYAEPPEDTEVDAIDATTAIGIFNGSSRFDLRDINLGDINLPQLDLELDPEDDNPTAGLRRPTLTLSGKWV